MRPLIVAAIVLLAISVSLGVNKVQAQPSPTRPIQLIIPGAAGSILDITGRILGDDIGKILGTQILPVVKPGAGFTLGTDFVARSKKAGYTLTYTNSSAIVYARVVNPETVPYD